MGPLADLDAHEEEKTYFPPPVFETHTVRTVTNPYTDYAIPDPYKI
jgi:hypothetical protein